MTNNPQASESAPAGARTRGSRGAALIEFAVVLPFLLLLLMATIDFGHLIQTRLIITNVSREGGSIASRAAVLDASMTNMVVASGAPLPLAGGDGRVYITKIKAGATKASPKPTIQTQLTAGSLTSASRITGASGTLGLTQKVYDHLTFKVANNTADIPEATIVEVIYKYRPITPLPGFIQGMLNSDGGGFIISSKAVF
jgi:Flp pilus assembly protein TadG